MPVAAADPAATALRARLLVVAAATLWGTTGTTQALAPAEATSATIGAARIGLGALGLGLLAVAGTGTRGWGRLAAAGSRVATLSTMVTMAAYQLCFFAGVARAGVALGTVVGIGSAPLFTGLFARVVFGERPPPVWFAATATAVVGTVLLIGGGPAPAHPLGIALAVAAGASYAAFTVSGKLLLDQGHPPLRTMAAAFGGGTLLLVPWLAGSDLSWVTRPTGAVAVLWLGLATVTLAYVLFARGLLGLQAPTVGTLTLAEPLTAATLGVLVLGERPALPQVAGASLVVTGLVLLTILPLVASRRSPSVP